MARPILVADLFCGAGGSSTGAELAFGSICSGIEAASVAWEGLGWRCEFVSEIEAFPRAVLLHRLGAAPFDPRAASPTTRANGPKLMGDFTKIGSADVGAIDLLVGGTPCQSFSVAGRRLGMDDPRGNLAVEFLALARRLRPRWLVWENVPGVRSSYSGAPPDEEISDAGWEGIESSDFGLFLGLMGECGYGWAYRSFDAQFAGLAQQRERVFVVGHLGDWRGAAAVLFEPEGLRWDPAPRREARERIAAPITPGSPGGSGYRLDPDTSDNLIAHALNAHGGTGRLSHDSETFIAHALRGEGFDASEDGTGRGTPIVPIAFDTTQITSPGNVSSPKPGDPCHPLAAGAHPPAICFSAKDYGADAGELAPTLRAGGRDASHPNAGVMPAIAYGIGSDAVDRSGEGAAGNAAERSGLNIVENCQPSLRARPNNSVATASAVRRLTPRECERLQGFPDDWTLVPFRGKPAADGPRYKALGNSMAVPVMRWIGERIDLFERAVKQ